MYMMKSITQIQALPSMDQAPHQPDMKQAASEVTLEISQPNDVHRKIPYLNGLRGILALQSLAWIFFSTFIPALVSSTSPDPGYQRILRDVLSVPFWNTSFISSFFIILSMRTICARFLSDPTSTACAGSLIRRIVRFSALLFVASGLATLIMSQIGVRYIDEFKTLLPNTTIKTPATAYSWLAALNSIFDLFWLTTGFATQAANTFWPSATLWVPSVIYYQGWTVYILMVILPFTRPTWHFTGMALFALGSFWYASWGWYSATGLFLADLACNEELNRHFRLGIRLRGDARCPSWVVGVIMAAMGLAFKYAFTVLPQYSNSLLVLHPFLDLSEQTSRSAYVAEGPYPRLDDWLLITGIMVLVEFTPKLQKFLSMPVLTYLGERAFSLFTTQSIIFWTAGIKLWLVLHLDHNLSIAAANAVVLVVCVPATFAFAEIFYWVVDLSSRWLGAAVYHWLMN